jgi:hypothetical protein
MWACWLCCVLLAVARASDDPSGWSAFSGEEVEQDSFDDVEQHASSGVRVAAHLVGSRVSPSVLELANKWRVKSWPHHGRASFLAHNLHKALVKTASSLEPERVETLPPRTRPTLRTVWQKHFVHKHEHEQPMVLRSRPSLVVVGAPSNPALDGDTVEEMQTRFAAQQALVPTMSPRAESGSLSTLQSAPFAGAVGTRRKIGPPRVVKKHLLANYFTNLKQRLLNAKRHAQDISKRLEQLQ